MNPSIIFVTIWSIVGIPAALVSNYNDSKKVKVKKKYKFKLVKKNIYVLYFNCIITLIYHKNVIKSVF